MIPEVELFNRTFEQVSETAIENGLRRRKPDHGNASNVTMYYCLKMWAHPQLLMLSLMFPNLLTP